MDRECMYLYGVMAAGTAPTAGLTGLGGAAVEVQRCGEFDALFSWLTPAAAGFQAEGALAHEQVLTQAMETATVIPVAYGHLLDDPAELCQVLDAMAPSLQADLQRLIGRVEIGLKAIWPQQHFLPDIETPELRAALEQEESAADSDYAAAVGELVEQLVQVRREEYVAAVCPKLAQGAVDFRLSDPVTPRMIFNAAFLVPRDGQDAFFQHVQRVLAPYPDLEFHYSGPWPPHHFAGLWEES